MTWLVLPTNAQNDLGVRKTGLVENVPAWPDHHGRIEHIAVYRKMLFSLFKRAVKRPFCVCLILPILTACSSLPISETDSFKRSRQLAMEIAKLGETIDPDEANRLAEASVEKAIHLAHQYRAVRPAWFHNVLVNHGFRARGLCFEWANDMFLHLHQLQLHTLELHLAVARMDTRREHNAIVVTPVGGAFQAGLVLDAWRNSGLVWSGRVSDDRFPWNPLPRDRVDPEIQKHLAR